MNVSDYLQGRLEHCAAYTLTDADRAVLTRGGIEAFVFKTLTSKKFRKWAIDEQTHDNIQQAIRLNVAANEPIKLTFPFGGYKLWRLPTAPEVDWAEFFTISYYLSYLAPIAAAHPPGATLSFCSDDIIIERMNNIPDADQNIYAHSFNVLLDAFRAHLPHNVAIELMRVRDMYPDRNEYERELAANIERFEREFDALDPSVLAAKEKSSALNIRWDGVHDLMGLTNEEKSQMIRRGATLHDATCYVSKRQTFVRGPDKIVIFGNRIRNSIPIGTTKSSRTKFWTGFGVLERRGDEYLERILSPEQYEKTKNVEHEIVPVDFIPLKNFSEINVYSQQFDFSQSL